MNNPQPTLVEGVFVPENWVRRRRDLRHIRSTHPNAANGHPISLSETSPHSAHSTLQHVRALQVERAV